MPKLADLKALLEGTSRDARAAAPARAPASTPPRHRPPALPHARVQARRRIAASKHAETDIDLGDAFADVQRLPPHNRAPSTRSRPLPHARSRLEDEREALELSKYGAEPAPHSWDIGQEIEGEQTFVRRGLGRDVLVKLRRGHWVVQAVIDLHGMTTSEAHDVLSDFLLDARNRGLRCVRVIHGKGLTSPNREPVLKGKVRRWLMQWDDVLAYCEAPRHAGGSGAVVALLRGR
ncbi:MAG TPA: Smr/MutS family protein [Casimicrobiaceae bacterium]|nr:Smr/MutS family protein [Casimicrobiaceae bacterium]